MKLSEFLISNDEIYKKIYDIIALENRLPSADEIRILDNEEAIKFAGRIRETVMAFALPQERALWFRHMPPNPPTFAHELIHLAKKKRDSNYEEIYGYNLADFVVFLALNNITPRTNPLRLFEDVTLQMLSNTIAKVAKIHSDDPREVIKEFFTFWGVIPLFLTPTPNTENGDGIDFVIDDRYADDDIVIITLTELLAAIRFDFLAQEIVFHILNNL